MATFESEVKGSTSRALSSYGGKETWLDLDAAGAFLALRQDVDAVRYAPANNIETFKRPARRESRRHETVL